MKDRIRSVPETARKIEAPDLTNIETELGENIIGQPDAVKAWAGVIHDVLHPTPKLRRGPRAVVLETGPSGVGKTQIVSEVARYLSKQNKKNDQDDASVLRIDCGEYQEKHEVAKVLGSPPGYVGGDRTPRLAQSEINDHAILLPDGRRITIVLFDEVEKAHENLNNTLLGSTDNARITLGDNSTTNLEDCVLVFASNLGNKEIQASQDAGRELTTQQKRAKRVQAVKQHFSSEQVSRMGGDNNMIFFNELTEEQATTILMQKLGHLEDIYEKQGTQIAITLTEEGLEKMLEEAFSPEHGIRPMERIIEREIIQKMGVVEEGSTVIIDGTEDGLELFEESGTTNVPDILHEKKVEQRPPTQEERLDDLEEKTGLIIETLGQHGQGISTLDERFTSLLGILGRLSPGTGNIELTAQAYELQRQITEGEGRRDELARQESELKQRVEALATQEAAARERLEALRRAERPKALEQTNDPLLAAEKAHPMIEKAKELLGRDFLGVEAVRTLEAKLREKGENVEFLFDELPEFPYTERDLEIAKENGEMLILRPGMMLRDMRETTITIQQIKEMFGSSEFSVLGDANEELNKGWKLVKKKHIAGSEAKSWDEQAEILEGYNRGLHRKGAHVAAQRKNTVSSVWDTIAYYNVNDQFLLENQRAHTHTYPTISVSGERFGETNRILVLENTYDDIHGGYGALYPQR